MASHRSTGTLAAVLCVLTLFSCAKQHDSAEAGLAAQPTTSRAGAPTAGPGATAAPSVGARAPGAPIGQGQGGGAPGGPIGGGSKDSTALASPITIPAIQQNGQPVDDHEIYPGGVIGFVENDIRSQCPDGTLCGFTVTAVRHEPDTAPEASAVRDFCALTPTEAQGNSVTVTHPVDIPLNCVWRYKEADITDPDPDPAPDITDPDPAAPDITDPDPAAPDITDPDPAALDTTDPDPAATDTTE
jgi:hypothetical protein